MQNKEDLWKNPSRANNLLQQVAALERKVRLFEDVKQNLNECEELYDISLDAQDTDAIHECIELLQISNEKLRELRINVLFNKPEDSSSCIIELLAGAGGTDSCDWVELLSRMYIRWCEKQNYKVRIVQQQYGEEAGYRQVCLRIEGSYAYGWARLEVGVHRLVRLSPFDSQNRRHTSFAQVRVYPLEAMDYESNGVKGITISPKDIRIDTYRASGPGGQHVNKTDSAIRITHFPSGIVVQSQNDRSQHRNKAEAMDMLKAKLYQLQLEAKTEELREYTKGLGDNTWGNQIRSYILHPYKMIKDHRTSYQVNDVHSVLDGDLQCLLEAILIHSQDI